MKSRKLSSPLLFALVTGATISLTQVATAQPVASPGMHADGRAESLVIRARIMLSQAQQDRLQAHADQGIESLRRYLWRTRMIYNYYMPDLFIVER
jgi:hypothetical protein